MKHLQLILFISLSLSSFGQTKKADKTSFPSTLIEGTWANTYVDSTFGHKTELKYTFTNAGTFSVLYSIDKELKERYVGKYKIKNGNLLELTIRNKPIRYLKIIQVSLDFLSLKEQSGNEPIHFIRE